jgi:hypothetical protein
MGSPNWGTGKQKPRVINEAVRARSGMTIIPLCVDDVHIPSISTNGAD